MTAIVIMISAFTIVVATCIGLLVLVVQAVRTLADFNPTVKVVQEYNVVGDGFSDIYNEQGDYKEKEQDTPNFDDILKEFNELFTEDEVKSNE